MKYDQELVPQIVDYLSTVPDQASGTLNPAVLGAIAALVPEKVYQSVESGCGKTTILL